MRTDTSTTFVLTLIQVSIPLSIPLIQVLIRIGYYKKYRWEIVRKWQKPLKTPKKQVGNGIFGGKKITSKITTDTGENTAVPFPHRWGINGSIPTYKGKNYPETGY